MPRFAWALAVLVSTACERAPAPTPAPSKPAKGAEGLPEVQRARAEVEKHQQASQQRTEDALDRATKGEQVERGNVPAR